MNSITRLEPAKQFVTRVVLLNRYHTPDEEDYDAARHVLGAIHHGFPATTVEQQAAHIVAGICANKPFAAANFRTAMDYVSDMLEHHEFYLDASRRDQQDLGSAVWQAVDDGAKQEDLAELCAGWFKGRITGLA